MENSRRYGICEVDVPRASYANHFISENHLENKRQDDIKTPEWLFKEDQTHIKRVYNLKTIKQIARESIKINGLELGKKKFKKINPHCFMEENSKTGFKITLENHNTNHAKSVLTITPIYPDFGFKTRQNNKI